MRRINFDHLSCSPLLPGVREAMLPFFAEDVGNPLSHHLFGKRAAEAVEEARETVAALVGARPGEVIFTSCGSESNNLAVKGAARAGARKGRHIIASPIEHHSVLHPLKRLAREGFEVSWLSVDGNGSVDPQEVSSLIRDDTILVTVTSASNEIGTLEPTAEIGAIARERGALFHTDAVACAGSVPIDVEELGVDLLSVAGNVLYGPPGTGALYVRRGVRLLPLIEGGIQERGLRAGTHNLPGIVGMGAAARAAGEKLAERSERLTGLREELIEGVLRFVPDCFLTGHRTARLPGHASFCIKFIEGESILLRLNSAGIAGTTGSTCASEALKTSHVLEAIGIDGVSAQGSLTFTLGIENTREDVQLFLKTLPPVVEKLRKMSPLVA